MSHKKNLYEGEAMKILVGTRNPAKFDRYRTILQHISGVEVCSLNDVQLDLIVEEDGISAEDNARKKARAYADAAHIPTLSVDEALYFAALPESEQPGVYVRRYGGKEATDEEMLALYVEKIQQIAPQKRQAVWIYAICLALPHAEEFCAQVRIEAVFTDIPRLPLLPGYPLSSILVDPSLGKSLRDLTSEEEKQRLQPVYVQVESVVKAAFACR